jgi:uncharacterized SAM-binding protein YcdF (DUF218 family)
MTLRNRFLSAILLVIVAVLVGYTEALLRVSWASDVAVVRTAQFSPDVVIVLGAAVWGHDRPSPVLERRLRKALAVARSNNVLWMATTGGVGRISHRSALAREPAPLAEGVVAAHWLHRQGVPEARVLIEQRSRNTLENIRYLAPTLRAHALWRVVLITDGYHIARSVMIAQDAGLTVRAVASDGGVDQSLAREPERRFSEARWLLLYGLVRPTVRW